MERTKKEKNYKKLFNRFLTYVLLFAGIFALCYSTRQIVSYISTKKENNDLQQQLSSLKEANENLENLNDKLKDKDYFSIYVKDKYQYSPSNEQITPIN